MPGLAISFGFVQYAGVGKVYGVPDSTPLKHFGKSLIPMQVALIEHLSQLKLHTSRRQPEASLML